MTTQFTTWKFLATGGSPGPSPPDGSRALPVRLTDFYNVIDFGADPSGATDSQPAIQNIINNLGIAFENGVTIGTIYFPPGSYTVNNPITFDGPSNTAPVACGIRFLGELGLSTITGNFADFVFKRGGAYVGGQDGIYVVEKLKVVNQNTTAGGGIKIGGCSGGLVIDCIVSAWRGIWTNQDTFNGADSYDVSVKNCRCSPVAGHELASGSIGLFLFPNGRFTGNVITNYDKGIATYGGEGTHFFAGMKIEGNNIGINFGDTTTGVATDNRSCVLGCHFKNNGSAIVFTSTDRFLIAGCYFEGQNGTIGGGNPQYGIRYTPSNSNFMGVNVTGSYDQSGIYLGTINPISFNENQRLYTALRSVQSVSWGMPPSAQKVEFKGCNQSPVTVTVSTLPIYTVTVTNAVWNTNAIIGYPNQTSAGSGYTPGFYSNVALTAVTGVGTGASIRNVSVAGDGTVSSWAMNLGTGQNYAVGDQLSVANLGGTGTGFTLVVAATSPTGGSGTGVATVALLTVSGVPFGDGIYQEPLNHNLWKATVYGLNATGGSGGNFNGTFFPANGGTPNTLFYAVASNPGTYANDGSGKVDLNFLGTDAQEGDSYNVTNCVSSTFADIAVLGGTVHAKVRYNGANFTVIGK